MSETAIRAKIKTKLESVSNIGNVYDTERYFNNEADRLAIMKATISSVDQIRSWMFSQNSSDEKQIIVGVGATSGVEIKREYIIKGWLGLRDSETTEKTLLSLVELITSAFRTDRTLTGSCFLHEGIKVIKISHIDMTGILCNYCELSLVVLERV